MAQVRKTQLKVLEIGMAITSMENIGIYIGFDSVDPAQIGSFIGFLRDKGV
jgi:hypothetical protein